MIPTVFLDRDGTLNLERPGWLDSPALVELVPGAGKALARLSAAGYRLALLTNQSGIGRGKFSEDTLAAIHERLAQLLAADGARLDVILYCPHHPTEAKPEYRVDCDCRKPKPGMMLAAARTLDSDLSRSYSIGDDLRDLEPTLGSLVTPILVLTGKGKSMESRAREVLGDRLHVVADLAAAADLIVRRG